MIQCWSLLEETEIFIAIAINASKIWHDHAAKEITQDFERQMIFLDKKTTDKNGNTETTC